MGNIYKLANKRFEIIHHRYNNSTKMFEVIMHDEYIYKDVTLEANSMAELYEKTKNYISKQGYSIKV